MERLHKVLARAGLGSRRACEKLIAQGKVSVNGEIISRMGVQVDPASDDIRFEGRPIKLEEKVYFLLNKPRNYITTQSDEFGRRKAADLLKGVKERVYPVGRLDKDSEGILLFTNDGELANYLTHPRYGVPKTYLATVKGKVDNSIVNQLQEGMHLAEGKVKAVKASVRFSSYHESAIEVTLQEGVNRQVRRMLAQLGHKVKTLRRVRIGNLTDKYLPLGSYRRLEPEEVEALRKGNFEKQRPGDKRGKPRRRR